VAQFTTKIVAQFETEINNKDFSERVMSEIPASVLEGSLLQEHVAAKSGKAVS
jgi:hypothetical protein